MSSRKRGRGSSLGEGSGIRRPRGQNTSEPQRFTYTQDIQYPVPPRDPVLSSAANTRAPEPLPDILEPPIITYTQAIQPWVPLRDPVLGGVKNPRAKLPPPSTFPSYYPSFREPVDHQLIRRLEYPLAYRHPELYESYRASSQSLFPPPLNSGINLPPHGRQEQTTSSIVHFRNLVARRPVEPYGPIRIEQDYLHAGITHDNANTLPPLRQEGIHTTARTTFLAPLPIV